MEAKWIRLHVHPPSDIGLKPLPKKPPQQQLRSQNRDLPASDQDHLCRIIPVASLG